MNLNRRTLAVPVLLAGMGLSVPAAAQSVAPVDLGGVINRLGAYDFQTRIEAARAIRRADAAAAIRGLDQAARSHADSYVRFRALVLLSGFVKTQAEKVAARLQRERPPSTMRYVPPAPAPAPAP